MLEIFTKLADWTVFDLFGLDPEAAPGLALHFFVEDVSKIFALLLVMIYAVSFLRAGLDTDRIRDFLAGKRRGAGYFLASAFGAVTPFCSCSSIPLFLAFTSARIPLGITMAFLITSPMINEVAIILLGSILGLRFMVLYLAAGMAAGILGGMFIDLIGAERYLTPIGKKAANATFAAVGKTPSTTPTRLVFAQRHTFAVGEVGTIFARVWKWVLIGVGLGALLHGYVPAELIESALAGNSFWSVPAAVAVGIPLYANASGIIPVIESLLAKGVPVGTALAFMMSVVAASFPEFMMLKQVMKPRLLVIFFVMLLVFFTLAGWIFNLTEGVLPTLGTV